MKTKESCWMHGVPPLFAAVVILGATNARGQTAQEQLGGSIYNDLELSNPPGQGCVSCHHPSAGFADPDQGLPVSEGAVSGLFGGRNSPSAAYAMFFPEFTLTGGIKGGQFWDGRAANLTEQAKGPFLNPVEMNNESQAEVIGKIAGRPYADAFLQVCGAGAFDTGNVATSYQCMAEAIAAFEMTAPFASFSSKFDAVAANQDVFTSLEERGRALFSGKAKCGHCHTAKVGGGAPVIFSDFKFHNIGLPGNQDVYRLTGESFVDLGLGGVLGDSKQDGKFKTSHLRDIVNTPPYMHNGVLATLEEVVHFYNTRDVLAECDPVLGSDDPGFSTDCWPAPEVPYNIDTGFVGDLGLDQAEEDAIVAFMLTFTDGYVP